VITAIAGYGCHSFKIADAPCRVSGLQISIERCIAGRCMGDTSKQGAVVPLDLSDALERIREIGPKLTETPSYRRLAAAARR
jgi:hypothetical protein